MATPKPHPLALPSTLTPDALDTLSELSLILSRLKTPTATGPSASQPSTGLTPSQSQSLSGATAVGSASSQAASSLGEIHLRDVPAATDGLKHKLQRARGQVRQLPDMQRTIAEQEEEIAMLQERIAKQKELLEMLKAVRPQGMGGDEDVSMSG